MMELQSLKQNSSIEDRKLFEERYRPPTPLMTYVHSDEHITWKWNMGPGRLLEVFHFHVSGSKCTSIFIGQTLLCT